MDSIADPAARMEALDAVRAETLRRLDGRTQDQLDWRPPDGAGEAAWSLGEIFMHLATHEYYLGDQLGRFWLEGVQPPDGERSLPAPPFGVPADEIRQLFADTRTRTRNLIETWQATPALAHPPPTGAATVDWAAWLTVYGEHEVSHQRQMDALLARLPGESTLGTPHHSAPPA
jgi:hypothetical protein